MKAILDLDIPRIFFEGALQGYFAIEHCRDIFRLGITGIFCGWALQGYFVFGQ